MLRIVVATISILILDGIWLGFIAKKLYIQEMGSFLRLQGNSIDPLWIPALIVYCALILGIVLFVIPKANGVPLQGLLWGGIFGLVTYATYDFTNLAVLSNWSVKISIIDTCWGIVLCGITTFVTMLITK